VAGGDRGSLTKEPPLSKLDATIRAIKPRMQYAELLIRARKSTHRDAPGLARQRFLLINLDGSIAYDHFLSLVAAHGLNSPLVRKVMYFVWAYRDDRIRRFVCERIANKYGLWSVGRVLDKKNSEFFKKWVDSSTATKARSNFERFLVETKIFDPKSEKIHLELDDGWLQQAAIVAAQHERNAGAREELLANPIAFLERRGWLGLLNANRANAPIPSPVLVMDSTPLGDMAIKIKGNSTQTSSDWNRRRPNASGKSGTTVSIDLVAHERANLSHFSLEKHLADLAKAKGLTPKYNQNIDLYFKKGNSCVLVEVKSCTDDNFHSQIRKAISQLFEYRFVYKELLGSDVTMLLLMETAPPKEKTWLVDYAFSLGILVAWTQAATDAIVTTNPPPKSLAGFVRRIIH
jgi:hypothetical protein